MVDNDEKYAGDEEDLTQVRSIIKQLNEDKPSTEKRREVVVRADGSKVVRVTKKRRVMMTSADHRRRDRRQLVLALLGIILLAAGVVSVFFYRMAEMTGSAYVAAAQRALQERWGAESLHLEGPGVEGTSLKLTSLVAEFPETGMLQRIELHGVDANLNMVSFFTRVLEGEELQVQRALIVLRPGAVMSMPVQNGADMWKFRRVNCNDFTVQFGDSGVSVPLALNHTQAYMYYPARTADRASVVIFRGGNLELKGWNTVRINEGKARVDVSGITDFSFSGTTDAATDVVEQRRTSIAFAGKIAEGADFAGPYAMSSDNMKLADFTGGRFAEFLTARTVSVGHGRIDDKATIRLATTADRSPEFSGEIHLKEICLSSFPALMAITEHIEPAKRRFYNPLSLQRGYVRLGSRDDSLSIELPDGAVLERDLIHVRGRMELSAQNELTGNLEYGVPVALTRVEYADGQPDPVFQQDGDWAWLRTRLKGQGNMPGDDMAEVEARAAVARRERPARLPFSEIDVNRLTEQLQSGNANPFESVPAPQATQDAKNPFEPETGRHPFDDAGKSNPFGETSEDPFAPSSSPF